MNIYMISIILGWPTCSNTNPAKFLWQWQLQFLVFLFNVSYIFFNLNNPTAAKINFDLTEIWQNIQSIHNLTKNKAWYTFNQKLCFNFQPGTLRIINFHKLWHLTAQIFLESTILRFGDSFILALTIKSLPTV
jgi:hypothetical protein